MDVDREILQGLQSQEGLGQSFRLKDQWRCGWRLGTHSGGMQLNQNRNMIDRSLLCCTTDDIALCITQRSAAEHISLDHENSGCVRF